MTRKEKGYWQGPIDYGHGQDGRGSAPVPAIKSTVYAAAAATATAVPITVAAPTIRDEYSEAGGQTLTTNSPLQRW